MRRIGLGVAAVLLFAGVPLRAQAATSTGAGVCDQPRLLIFSAFPAEMGTIMKATKLDSTEPIRSPAPKSKEFWSGTLEGKPVIESLTGIGPVNATDTTNAAFQLFPCIQAVVFSGVAGAGNDHNGANGAARQSRIGDVTVPDLWTNDGGQTWATASGSMLSTAAKIAPSVTLQSDAPL